MTESKTPGRFRRAATRALTVIGAFTVAFFIFIIVVPLLLVRTPGVPAGTILELDLTRGLTEYTPDHPIAIILEREQLTVRDIVDALERAETDGRVVALVARVAGDNITLAQAEELREAVAAFRGSGKRTVAYAETFGEFTSGNATYYLATGFDEIYLQPSGDLGLTGLTAEVPFVAETLEMVGVEPQLSQRYEYKDAVNLFTETQMTAPQREATERVLASMFANLVTGIAEGRAIPPERVRELIDGGPYYGAEAVGAGLVDGLAYRDEVYDRLLDDYDGEDFLFLERYLARAGRPNTSGPEIALIHGVGAVQTGPSQVAPLAGGVVMGAETVTRAFRDAIEAEAVQAIVFRVDSPGGSYVGSDAIWRETIRAREAGKPVIVSMASVAGSGGYFVAMGADRIVAHPSTITGSIGVYGGKFVIDDLSNRLGVTWDRVRIGENAGMWSFLSEFSPEERERLEASMDRIYQDFTGKVAQGRGLTPDSVHAIARGRIWSGADAQRLGLVDELGGLRTAVALAKQAAGVAPDESVTLQPYPRGRSLLEILLEPDRSSSYPTYAAWLRTMVGGVNRVMGLLGGTEWTAVSPAVRMPTVPQVR